MSSPQVAFDPNAAYSSVSGGSAPAQFDPSAPYSSSQPQPSQSDGWSLTNNPVTHTIEGIGEGALQTLTGTDRWAREHLPAVMTNSNLGFGKPADLDKQDQLVGRTGPVSTAEKVGQGGENIAEFILGDAALKGVSLSEKLGMAQKVTSLAEKNPYIAKLLDIGMSAMRQGTVGAVQGVAHSNEADTGDVLKDGLNEGALTGATSGVLEGVSPLVGKIADKTGISSVGDWLLGRGHNLADTADSIKLVNGIDDMFNAKAAKPPIVDVPRPNMDRQSLGDFIKAQVDESEMNMHDAYQNGLDDFTGSTNGKAVPLKGSPLQDAAAKWLPGSVVNGAEGTMADAVNNIVPGTERIRPLLNHLADPESDTLLNADQLVTLRQNLGKQFRRLTWNDPNKEVIRNLFDGIDDTLDQIGGDNKAYQTLRQNYKTTLGDLKDPVVQKLQKGGIDDVTKYLTSGGNTTAKAEALQRVLGDGSWKQSVVSQNMFLHAVQDSTSEDGVVDIQKLSKNWNKIPEPTKNAIFGSTPEGQNLKGALNDVIDQAAKRGDHIQLTKNLVRAGGTLYGLYEGNKGNPTGALIGVAAALTGGGDLSKLAVEGLTSPAAMKAEGKVLIGTGNVLNAGKNAVTKAATSPQVRSILTGEVGTLSGSGKSSKNGFDSLSGRDQ